MSTVKLTAIADDVLLYLAAAPSAPLVLKEVRKTLMELCVRTTIWRAYLDPLTVVAGYNTIEITGDTGATIAELITVELSGVPLEARTIGWLNENVQDWKTSAGVPRFYTQMRPDELILAPLPASRVSGGLKIVAAQQPARDATTIPAWLYDRYQEEILNGACSRLMLLPNKPWTDEANGADRRDRWISCLGAIKAQAATSYGAAPIRTRTCH